MKLLSLNLQHGKHLEALLDFLKEQAEDIDIFCFQEVQDCSLQGTSREGYKYNLWEILRTSLPQFEGRFDFYTNKYGFSGKRSNTGVKLGQAFFTRKGVVEVLKMDAHFVLEKLNKVGSLDGFPTWPTLVQIAEVKKGDAVVKVGNYHGISQPGHKKDTPTRRQQSKRLIELLKGDFPTVLVGDMNLDIDTQSVKDFEDAGYINLIKTHKIKTTRSTLTPYCGTDKQQNYADYFFVMGAEVEDFLVLPDEVSDHLAMRGRLKINGK